MPLSRHVSPAGPTRLSRSRSLPMGRLSVPVALVPLFVALLFLALGALPAPLFRSLADGLAGDGSASSLILQRTVEALQLGR